MRKREMEFNFFLASRETLEKTEICLVQNFNWGKIRNTLQVIRIVNSNSKKELSENVNCNPTGSRPW